MDKEPNNKNRLSLQSVRESLRTLSLSTLLLIVTTAVALVAVGSLAWVSENRKLDADGTHMNMDGEAFEVGVDAGIAPNSDLSRILTGLSNSHSNGFSTDSYSVLCMLSIETDGQSSEATFRPRATGTMTFKITPNSTEYFSAALSISAIGYTLDNGELGYEYLSEDTIQNDPRLVPLNFLKGHVLFFKSRTPVTANGETYYTYGDRIEPGEEFNITGISNNDGTDEYSVTIYWEWPRTYDRLRALLGYAGDNNAAAVPETETEINRIISANLNRYLTSAEIDPGAAYNEADTEIGMHIGYVVAEVTVTESTPIANAVNVAASPVTP